MNFAPQPALQRQIQRSSPSEQPSAPIAVAPVPTGDFTFCSVAWQADGFGFDVTSGEFFTASPTALLVMQALSEKLSRQQILDRLTATFEVTLSTAERDLESFLAELAHIGITPTGN